MVHVRVNKKLKDEALKEARNLGVSLSLITEQAYRDFVGSKRLVVESHSSRLHTLQRFCAKQRQTKITLTFGHLDLLMLRTQSRTYANK